jgi:hypothetical protein
MINQPILYSLVAGLMMTTNALACTDEFKPVCGYWMHSSKTQTFINECKMHEAGAKNRHAGSCADQKPTQSTTKPSGK